MKKLRIELDKISIHWDKDYGIDKRTGWSICIDGSFTVQLERFLLIAIIKSFRVYFFVWEKEYRCLFKKTNEMITILCRRL